MIDYRPLEVFETPAQRARAERYLNRQQKFYVPFTLKQVAAWLGTLLVFAGFVYFALRVSATLGQVLLYLGGFGSVGYFLWRASQRHKVTQAWAAANGWSCGQPVPDFMIASITPALAKVSRGGAKISGAYGQTAFWFYAYAYEYVDPSSRLSSSNDGPDVRRETFQTVTYRFPVNLPVFLLDATTDGRQKQLDIFGAPLQRLELEGDFNKYFTLYQRPGDQIDVLSFITPEFMALLADEAPFLNFQTDGQYLHVFSNRSHGIDYSMTKNLFDKSRLLVDAIERKLNLNRPAQ
ncbi:MAG: hypothetical protein JWM37_576 [Candidatus Saccharibacteria bacterium]|nr:hypothetical protein [Candidatus Saccharibacteria bacterium]